MGSRLSHACLSFLSPRKNAFVFVPRELDGSTGRVVFEAPHDERGESVERRFTVVERSRAGSASLPDGPVVQLVRTAGS